MVLFVACSVQAVTVFFLFNAIFWGTLFGHIICSLLFSWSLWRLMPQKFHDSAAILSLLFLLCFLIPLVSGICLLVTVTINLYYSKAIEREISNSVNEIELPSELVEKMELVEYSSSGGSGLTGLLKNSGIEESRIKAVLATRQLDDKEAIPILRVGLLDPIDEVRLLAYSMLDKKEKLIARDINKALNELKQASKTEEILIHQVLAEAYWELAFLGLAQGQAKVHILNSAYQHVQRVIQENETDAEAYFLQAQITLELNLYDIADESFKQALVYGLPFFKVMPYLAELAFVLRRFDEIGIYLTSENEFDNDNEEVEELLGQWK